jgi:hypothetical protein
MTVDPSRGVKIQPLEGGQISAVVDRTRLRGVPIVPQAVVMTSPTHATLATFRIDLAPEADQREGLECMGRPTSSAASRLRLRTLHGGPGGIESPVLLTYDSLGPGLVAPSVTRY